MRLREHRDTLCKGGCGLQRERHSLFRGCHRKTPKPCLKPPRATKRQVFPRSRGASGEPRHRPVKLREGQTLGTQNAEPPPPPSQVPAGLCTAADAPTVGPKTTPPPPALPISLPDGTKERGEELAARGARECPQPELGTWDRGSTVTPKARLRCPQLRGRAPLTDAEPLRRRLAGRRLPRDHGDP